MNIHNRQAATHLGCPSRFARLCLSITQDVDLNLSGRTVLTECATGAYCSTAIMAALAGARVFAFGRDGRHGTFLDARDDTARIAGVLGVDNRITYVTQLNRCFLAEADIITNSGHLRPLDGPRIEQLREGAVIPLMYEAWEFRTQDIDLESCRAHSVRVVGTNEHHPKLRIFDYLGMLVLSGLFRSGIPALFCKVLLLSDNGFCEPIGKALTKAGARVFVMVDNPLAGRAGFETATDQSTEFDAVVLATTPRDFPNLGFSGAAQYSPEEIGSPAVILQLWGDVDRGAFPHTCFFPAKEPNRGHMGLLLNEIGPDAVLRLQAGGLRAAQELLELETGAVGMGYIDQQLA